MKDFLEAVAETGSSREVTLKSKHNLWRAQVGYRDWHRTDDEGHEWAEEVPFAPERMKPLVHNPSEGRANPRGIAYLYVATRPETAIAEVRPWVGARVSVANFQTSRDLRLIDCSKDHGSKGSWSYLLDIPIDRWDDLSPEEIERVVWSDINSAFARPVGPTDEHANYVPTQIISELFRDSGFDGIAYKSSLSEKGHNIVLFDVDAAQLKVCHLYEVKGVSYVSDECANPWYLKDGEFFTHVITDLRPVSISQASGNADAGVASPTDSSGKA